MEEREDMKSVHSIMVRRPLVRMLQKMKMISIDYLLRVSTDRRLLGRKIATLG